MIHTGRPIPVSTASTRLRTIFLSLSVFALSSELFTQQPSPQLPQLVDITDSTGIKFEHLSSSERKYIVESMGSGVALIDYDCDGLLDIYFTNSPTVDMALAGTKARGALYRNNSDETFTDVTDKAGVGYPCFAMGAVVGDYNNDGWPDLLVTCLGGVVLYRNNGDGTFADVTKQAGLIDTQYATGAALGDYDARANAASVSRIQTDLLFIEIPSSMSVVWDVSSLLTYKAARHA
jgi:enediyne biosynthesis protein E4